jgi:hypothetical protein
MTNLSKQNNDTLCIWILTSIVHSRLIVSIRGGKRTKAGQLRFLIEFVTRRIPCIMELLLARILNSI